MLATHLESCLPHRHLDALKRLEEPLLALLQARSALHPKTGCRLPKEASLESKTRTEARHFDDASAHSLDVCGVLPPLP